MLSTFLYSLPLLASVLTQVTATPGVVGLPFTKVKRTIQGRSLGRRQTDGTIDTPLTQTVDRSEYIVNITVGTPPQSLAVQLDTGSSDLWIPAITSQECAKGACDFGSFDPTTSSTYEVVSAGTFSITYQQANDVDSGDFARDTVTFAGGTTIKSMQFGLALTETVDTHGVMGVSYNVSEAIVAQQGGQAYPSILDQLVDGGFINRKAFSLWLNDPNSNTGSILFGGVDTTKYEGDLVGLPIQLDPFGTISEYLVSLTSISFTDDSGTTPLSSGLDTAALLDSGTTLTYLPNDAFTALVDGIGAVDFGDGNLVVPCRFAESNITVDYGFGGDGGPVIHVPMSALVGQEVFEPSHFSDASGGCQLLVGAQNGGVILGDSFLRSAYVVYDITNNEIAIAPAKFNVTSSSIVAIPAGTGLPGVSTFATATATDISPSDTSMAVAPAAVTAGETVVAGTPTFNLGSATAGSGNGGSGSSSSKGLAQPMRTGAIGAAALFGGAAAFMNM